MASRLSRFDGQASVEQHDALFGPGCQVAVGRHGHAQIVGQLGVDVRQTRGMGLTSGATQKLSPTGWPGVG